MGSNHIFWSKDSLVVLDQRELPHRKTYIRCGSAAAVAKAIQMMALRGAPLIGCAAAYGYALAAKRLGGREQERGERHRHVKWFDALSKAGKMLRQARPTAVNLMHAVDRMDARAKEILKNSVGKASLFQALKEEADQMFREDIETNRRMAEFGASLLPPDSAVLTYCNTGALATCGIGTAFGVIRRAAELGKVRHVYACETRPYLQGSRLTLWELMQADIPCTLITDNMAAHLMAPSGTISALGNRIRGQLSPRNVVGGEDSRPRKMFSGAQERIAAVLVGADRIAANADVANKIGTYGLAILARHHGIPFYVVAPTTTIDLNTPEGAAIPIEERSSEEVTAVGGIPMAPRGARARHPAFDVTPHELVTAVVTERGIVRPANETNLRKIFTLSLPPHQAQYSAPGAVREVVHLFARQGGRNQR